MHIEHELRLSCDEENSCYSSATVRRTSKASAPTTRSALGLSPFVLCDSLLALKRVVGARNTACLHPSTGSHFSRQWCLWKDHRLLSRGECRRVLAA